MDKFWKGRWGRFYVARPELENRHVRVIVDDAALGVRPTGDELEALLDEMASPINASLPKDFGRAGHLQ